MTATEFIKENYTLTNGGEDYICNHSGQLVGTEDIAEEYHHQAKLKLLSIADVSGSDLVKSDWSLRECFMRLRFDKNHHLGLGDIKLTIAQQEEICDLVERFYHCR